METVVKRMYEGLFLVDSGEAAADWQGVVGTIEKILGRSEADVVSLRKWDERKLAYDIAKKSRGTYILAYFNCDPGRISAIERDVQLSESIMRVMVLRTDKMRPEDIAKPTPAMVAEMDAAAAAAKREEAERQAAEAAESAGGQAAEAAEKEGPGENVDEA